MKFREWLKKHEGKDTIFGDLADDVKHDKSFPDAENYNAIYEHLDSKSSFRIASKVLRTFREAWAAYAKNANVRLPSEAEIEHKFCKTIEARGGLALKFVPSGWSGAPDRIVMLPGGVIKFVEFKVLGAEPRALQKFRLMQLKQLGFDSYVIDSIRDIVAFVELLEQEGAFEKDLCFENRDYDSIEGMFRV